MIEPVIDPLQAAAHGTTHAAILANAVTGVYGLSGVGKTSLIATAAEYCYDTFGKVMLYYSSDLGGWGTKVLSLIRLGIMRAYYVRNHVNAFETMELISLGAWPATLLDPETGFADPSVPLVLPRRLLFKLICPDGHVAGYANDEVAVQTTNVICPTCGKLTNIGTALRVERTIVATRGFEQVGQRAYDSMTQLNDWGMEDLQQQSAQGILPTSSSGGSALGSADAMRSGQFAWGTSSVAQYGFLQNRTYGWIANVRGIAGQIVPPIMTFGVEASKGDDASGGIPVFGPKIAGNARTSSLGGWLGNLCHATREPDDAGNMVHRLWLVNHMDPLDPRKIPYLAKHRGEPLGMPNYLQDPWFDDKSERDRAAWSVCSMGKLYQLLDQQLQTIQARDRARHPNAPGMQAMLDPAGAAAEAGGITAPPEAEVGVVVEAAAGPLPAANVIRPRRGRGIHAAVAVGPAEAPPSSAVDAAAVTASVDPPPTSATAIEVAVAEMFGGNPVIAQMEATLAAAAGVPAPVAVVAQPQPQPQQPLSPPVLGSPASRHLRRVPRPPA